MRLFLAINLEPATRQAIIDATQPLRAKAPSIGWVDETRLHLTLKFLGEQSEDIVHSIAELTDRVTSRHKSFSMRLNGIGAFPNFRRARVVWMGVHDEPRLELLHHDVEIACEQLGFALEGRPFRPHLTLARVRPGTDAGELRPLARASERIDFDEVSEVRTIDLMKSDTRSAGARYERLHAATLRPN